LDLPALLVARQFFPETDRPRLLKREKARQFKTYQFERINKGKKRGITTLKKRNHKVVDFLES
jgi:hypothetical protein